MASITQPFGLRLSAGDRWKWTVTLADYPASLWKLSYFFRGPGKLDVASAASGDDHLLDTLPAATTNLEPGTYGWQMVVELRSDATEHYELARGTVEILGNIFKAGADGVDDFRSWAQRSLDNIRKVLENTASREESEYQIAGRMLKVRTADELLKLKAEFTKLVKQEQIENGVASPNSNMVHVRFGRTS